MTRRVKTGALLVAGALGAGAAIAIAAVPDSGGTFHACYTSAVGAGTIPASTGPNIRLIDPSAGQTCDPAANEHAFTFNQQGQPGPQGAQGIQGPPGTSTITEPPAENAGHAAITFPGGKTRSGLAGTTLQLDVKTVGYAVTGPGAYGAGYAQKKSPGPELRVTRDPDKYSSALTKACASGTRLSKVVLTLYGGKEIFTLTNAYLSSVQLTGGQGGGIGPHLEELDEFVAEKITTQYASGNSGPLPALKYNAKFQGKL